nr:hypothetical protein [Tanacetum cinerariifolium]
MFLSQKKYTLRLLERAHMANCNPTQTSVDTESKLDTEGDPVADPSLYRSLVVDWAGCPTTRCSTSSYYVFLRDNLLSWSSKRQHTLSRSSAEAEYKAEIVKFCDATLEIVLNEVKLNIFKYEPWKKPPLLVSLSSSKSKRIGAMEFHAFCSLIIDGGASIFSSISALVARGVSPLPLTALRLHEMRSFGSLHVREKRVILGLGLTTRPSSDVKPEWSRHVTIVHQTKDLHTSDYTQLYDFLKYNQKEQASTLGTQTDSAPVYDLNGSTEVHNYENCYDNEIFNMLTQEEQYTKLLEPIPESHQVPQNDNDVISEDTSVE